MLPRHKVRALVFAALLLATPVPGAGAAEGALSLEGQVLDPRGDPVADATVRISTASGTVSARSDAAGNYRARLDATPHRIEAHPPPGAAGELLYPYRADCSFQPCPTFSEGEGSFRIALPGGGILRGFVRDRSGAPIVGAEVDAAAIHSDEVIPRARTNATGEYRMAVPQFGTVLTIPGRPSFLEDPRVCVLGGSSFPCVLAPYGETRWANVTVTNTTTLRGTVVLASGAPAANATFSIWADGDTLSATTGADGSYQLEAIPGDHSWSVKPEPAGEGGVGLEVAHTCRTLAGRLTDCLSVVLQRAQWFNVTLPPGGLVVATIREANGAVVPAIVSFEEATPGETIFQSPWLITPGATSGSLTLPPGAYRMTLDRNDGSAAPSHTIPCDPASDASGCLVIRDGLVTRVDLAFPPPAIVEGVVRDMAGAPVPFARVHDHEQPRVWTFADQRGRFRLQLAPGLRDLDVWPPSEGGERFVRSRACAPAEGPCLDVAEGTLLHRDVILASVGALTPEAPPPQATPQLSPPQATPEISAPQPTPGTSPQQATPAFGPLAALLGLVLVALALRWRRG